MTTTEYINRGGGEYYKFIQLFLFEEWWRGGRYKSLRHKITYSDLVKLDGLWS